MQTSQYRNRNKFARTRNLWPFRLWNRCVTIKALVWSCNMIVLFNELQKQSIKMTLTEHYNMIKHLLP